MNEKKLNFNQQLAAESIEHPVCILAGAGCGKTTVLVEHYLQLLTSKKLTPSQIVVTTFSEKSAADIKQSILKALHEKKETYSIFIDDFSQAPISTLHGLAGRILRESSLLLGIDPKFNILDENDSTYLKSKALHEVLESELESAHPALQNLIDAYGWKSLDQELRTLLNEWPIWMERFEHDIPDNTSEIEKTLMRAWKEIFLKVHQSYDQKKTTLEVLDFNDLEEKAIVLLSQHPWVSKHYQGLWKAFLIDEFQDTSSRQDKLLRLLLKIDPENSLPAHTHLAIVGDPKQSIYGFRGAKSHLFEDYQNLIERSGGRTFYLNENYRSPDTVLNFVNHLFSPLFAGYQNLQTQFHLDFSLEALHPDLIPEAMKIDEKRKLEAEALAAQVAELIQKGKSPQDFYLLFRSSNPMALYLRAFRKLKLPVFIKSGDSLFDRQEILDLIHALRLLVKPDHTLSWIGLLRSPAFCFSDEQLLQYRLENNSNTTWQKIHPFAERLLKQNRNQGPTCFLEWFLNETKLISIYAADESLSMKAQNILQFLNFISEWENHHTGGIKEFLEEIDNLIENGIKVNSLSDQLGVEDAITFMTIHQSKGLNLPIVVLPDLKESLNNFSSRSILCAHDLSWGIKLPDVKPGLKKALRNSETFQANLELKKKQEQEEENRIFYVATTRAKEKLILGFPPLPKDEENESKIANAKNSLFKMLTVHSNVEWISEPQKQEVEYTVHTTPLHFENVPHFQKNKTTHFGVTQLEVFLKSTDEYLERFIYQVPAQTEGSYYSKKIQSSLSALDRGQIIHEALCLLTQKQNALSLDEILNSLSAKHHLNEKQKNSLELIQNTLHKTLCHAEFLKILNTEEAFNEIPFRLKLGEYMVQGAIDRLIRQNDSWSVIDYKTHQVESLEGIPPQEEFEFQLKTYCLAASKMLLRPVLQAQVYFVNINKSLPLTFTTQELEIHETLLQNLMQEINKFVYSVRDGLPNQTNPRMVG